MIATLTAKIKYLLAMIALLGVSVGAVPATPKVGDVIVGETISIKKGGQSIQAVKYAYIGGVMDERVSSTTIYHAQKHGFNSLQEVKNQRDTNTRVFTTDRPDQKIYEFISVAPQYFQDTSGKWWQADYATTTPAQYDALPKVSRRHTWLSPFPVAFAQTTFFSGSGDGRVNNNGLASWAAARDDTDGSFADATEAGPNQGCYSEVGANYNVGRNFVPFDTSSLTDGLSVSSATLSLYIEAVGDADNDGDDFGVIVLTNQASPTALATTDFDQIKGTDGNFPLGAGVAMQEQSDRIDITGISTGAYTNWTLNATGLANVSTTGYSQFACAEGHDVINSAIAAASTNNINIDFSETAGTTKDPKLVVTQGSSEEESYFMQDIMKAIPIINQAFAK